MTLKQLLKLDIKKILTILILFVLGSVPGFIPPLTDPGKCINTGCIVTIGLPFPYVVMEWGLTSPSVPIFTLLNLVLDIIAFYLITCILFYPFRKKEEKPQQEQVQETYRSEQNVPNDNS